MTPLTPPQVQASAMPARGGLSRRTTLVALLIVGGGIFAFALLRASSPVIRSMQTSKPASPPSAPAAAPVSAPVVQSKWKNATREWLLNPRKGIAFDLPSVNRVAVWQGLSQPMLVVRCESNRIYTFVYTASAIQMETQDENHTVSIAFDDSPEVTQRWADSDDHDALFAPDGAAFARQVTQSRTLRFGYTPHNAPHAVAEFQLVGLTELIEPAAKQCGWKK